MCSQGLLTVCSRNPDGDNQDDSIPSSNDDGRGVLQVGRELVVEDTGLDLIGNEQEDDWSGRRARESAQYGFFSAAIELTISLLRRLSKVVLDVEALGLRVLCVGVRPVRDDDLVVRDASIAEILSLGSALVSEARKRMRQLPRIVH